MGAKACNVKKILSWGFLIIAIGILLVAFFLLMNAQRNKDPVSVLGMQLYFVATGSMEPTVETNGLVVVRNGGFDEVQLGDIVAFKSAAMNGQAAIHRVVEVTDEGLITQGDNNENRDGGYVTAENYTGKIVLIINATASYLEELNKPKGFWRMIILPLAVIVLLILAYRLITSGSDWRIKGLVISIMIVAISASVFISCRVYIDRSEAATNERLEDIATKFEGKTDAHIKTYIKGELILGIIEIPKLEIRYPIIAYEKPSSPDIAITKYSGPDLNELGNVVLAGHHSNFRNIFFTKLDRLTRGDQIIITDNESESRIYEMVDSRTVSSTDLTILDQDADKYQLTLISCTYDAEDRYVVIAEAVE